MVQTSITGLSAGTWHFQAVAINSAGTTNGADATFATVTPPAFSGIQGQGMQGAMLQGFEGPSSGNFTQSLTAALSESGSLAKKTAHHITATLSNVGALAKKITYPLVGGSLTETGAFAKKAKLPFTATLSSSGAFAHKMLKALTAVIAMTGALGTKSYQGSTRWCPWSIWWSG